VNSARLFFRGRPDAIPLAVGESVLHAAMEHGVELDHACGGVCACSTCHVKITKGLDCFSEASEDELDQLDEARDVGLDSRLGCQAKLVRVPADGTIEVTIPLWNVNAVREGAGGH
jgi:2Fe-2S ferredoxin